MFLTSGKIQNYDRLKIIKLETKSNTSFKKMDILTPAILPTFHFYHTLKAVFLFQISVLTYYVILAGMYNCMRLMRFRNGRLNRSTNSSKTELRKGGTLFTLMPQRSF